MGDNKKYRKQILGHEKQVAVHLEKIHNELKKPVPDFNTIQHWKAEIQTFQDNIEDLLRKLQK